MVDGNQTQQAQTEQQQDSAQNRERLYRFHYLSKPKIYHYKRTKWLSDGPMAKWGTQEMLTPPSEAAKKAVASPRVEQLAVAKSDKTENPSRPIYLYSCGRDSQINLVSEGAKATSCTARLEQLAKHKEAKKEFTEQHRDQYLHSCGRFSPIWSVDERAKTAGDRPRTITLAKHKEYHKEYQPEKPLPWSVSQTAKAAACSERLGSLSRPKARIEDQFRDPLWEISANVRNTTAAPRTVELARHKPIYDGYQYNFDHGNGAERFPQLLRIVSRNAKNANASSRIRELATPIVRQSMDLVQFDPEAFIIKPNTLNAYCTPRIAELATPITR